LSFAGATGVSGNVAVAMTVTPTTLSNNGSAITDCTTNPALSVGLSIDTSTCVISGTPNGAVDWTACDVTATNAVGSSAAASVTLEVAASAPTLSYAGATGTTGSENIAMTVTPTTLNTNGSAITGCTIDPALSVGLSIDTSTSVISGTPN